MYQGAKRRLNLLGMSGKVFVKVGVEAASWIEA